jgi:hypothetical protein
VVPKERSPRTAGSSPDPASFFGFSICAITSCEAAGRSASS